MDYRLNQSELLMKLKHTAALCTALALASLSVSVAHANEKKIDVIVSLNSSNQVQQMTPVELAAMLRKLGLDEAFITKSVAAAKQEGRATLLLEMNAPTAKQ